MKFNVVYFLMFIRQQQKYEYLDTDEKKSYTGQSTNMLMKNCLKTFRKLILKV